MNRVPRLFPNSTILCLGCGPSLTRADVDACRGVAPVIAINDAVSLAPWAEVLYACDAAWWHFHDGVPTFRGPKFSIMNLQPRKGDPGHPAGVTVLANTGEQGLERDPSGLRAGLRGGSNSGYQAINLAVHLGASRIVLLGYDMQPAANGRTHFFGDHPERIRKASQYGMFRRSFEALVDPLQQLGIDVVNCSRQTALQCFPRWPLADALRQVAA